MARGLILAARHPRPSVSARICHGRTDLTLAEPAEAGATALIAAAGVPVERIVSSPLSHAHTVARIVADRTGAALHVDDRLREMDFGTWEGQPWTAIPRADREAWARDPIKYRPGGGETMADVLRRIRHAWPSLASAAETTLLLTHAGPIRCLLHVGQGVPIQTAIQASIAYGSVIRFGK